MCANVIALPLFAAGNKKDTYRVLKRTPLGGDGGWDFLTCDSVTRRLYISRSNRVMIVDMDSTKLIGEIDDLQGVHGIALASKYNKGFITCGKEDKITTFNLKTLKKLGEVKTGKKPDAIIYDPFSKKIFAFNNGGTTATVVAADSDKSVATVELGGAPESAVTDGRGKIYVNLEDKSQVAVIDAKKMKTIAHWSLAPGEEPTGLAIDIKHRRLFSGCHNKTMVVLDADSGKIITTLVIGEGVDFNEFDSESQNAFSSNGKDGTLTVVHEVDPNTFSVVQNVQTQAGARTMALDFKTKQIWLVTATPKQDEEGHGKHPRSYEPDSFTSIVVGK